MVIRVPLQMDKGVRAVNVVDFSEHSPVRNGDYRELKGIHVISKLAQSVQFFRYNTPKVPILATKNLRRYWTTYISGDDSRFYQNNEYYSGSWSRKTSDQTFADQFWLTDQLPVPQ